METTACCKEPKSLLTVEREPAQRVLRGSPRAWRGRSLSYIRQPPQVRIHRCTVPCSLYTCAVQSLASQQKGWTPLSQVYVPSRVTPVSHTFNAQCVARRPCTAAWQESPSEFIPPSIAIASAAPFPVSAKPDCVRLVPKRHQSAMGPQGLRKCQLSSRWLAACCGTAGRLAAAALAQLLQSPTLLPGMRHSR